MKKQNSAFRKLFFSLVILLAGVQGVFAAMACEGKIYLKLPDGWKSAYAVAGGNQVRFTASPEFDGWLVLDASQVGGVNDAVGFNINESAANSCDQIGHCITPTQMNVEYMQMQDNKGFNCTDLKTTGELWISPDPDPTITDVPYVSSNPPDVKYFYIFLPNNAVWKSSIPMMSIDGKPGEALSADPDRCGWYFKRYVDEVPPTNVLIYRDDDEAMAEAIGINGDWEEAEAPTPIDLNTMFEFLGSNTLYFTAANEFADETNPAAMGWTTTDPGITGDCGYPLAALIYDTDASLHGAFTCNPDWFEGQTPAQASANACYYAGVPYAVVNSGTAKVPCIGVTTGMVTDILDKTTKKPTLTAAGRQCFGSQADEAFNAMFNYTPGVNENYCIDLQFSQTADGKYEFDSDTYQSKGATVPGGFYPAEVEPDASAMLSDRLPDAEFKRKAEGPVFFCADYNNQTSTTPEGLRTIHPTEGVPVSDLICNGPGWDGGIDCDGLFAAGSEFAEGELKTATGRAIQTALGVTWQGDGWGWSCPNMAPIGWNYYTKATENSAGTLMKKNQAPDGDPRWTSGKSDAQPLAGAGRNQHFCFESHANFRYKKGLRFSFRGDDDIWVYIDNKLAVDLGGTHLAAPAYVDLDKFVGASGAWTIGGTYDIDIFFCDRRTTMSNVRIKTNMFIQQTSGLKKEVVNKVQGVEDYTLKYCVTGDGSCGNTTSSGASSCHEGADLCTFLAGAGKTVDYSITTKKGDLVKSKEELAQSIIYFGGIDLTNRCDPKINKNALGGLSPNTYYLVASVDGKQEKFQFKVTGSLEIANKPGVAQDDSGNIVGEYDVTHLALASDKDNPTRVPLYISSMMDQGQSLLFDISSAIGQSYNLSIVSAATGTATSDLTLEVKDATGAFVPWTNTSLRYIGEGGVDTIYASIPMAFMKQPEQTYYISVQGRSLIDTLTFFVPKLVFVKDSTSTEQVTGDELDKEWRYTGYPYKFYLLALAPSLVAPGTYEPCGERCNFSINALDNSTGVTFQGEDLVSGRSTITVYSTKEYRAAENGIPGTPAKISVMGPTTLIAAEYSPIYFKNPPVPYPLFADIFDVRGKKPELQMVIDQPFFSMEQEYLDGIADSIVIYYNKNFYNHPDSLPNKIVVLWQGEGEEDSIVVEKDAFHGNMACGAAAGLADTLCLPRISLSGIDFSKEVKTANPKAIVVSFATFMDKGRAVTQDFSGPINDRVAPIIKAASVYAANEDWNKMTIELSEDVQANSEYAKNGFTVFLNSATTLVGADKYVVGVESPSAMAIAGDKVTIQFPASSDKGLSPHTGDYVRFRADTPIWSDVAIPAASTDVTLRPADDVNYNWNAPTDYNSTNRLPSPWAPITGEAETGVKSKTYTQVLPDVIPTEISTPKGYVITDSYEDVVADNPGVLGYFLMSDMYSLIYADSAIANYFTSPEHAKEIDDIYLEYELDVFTNLGNFVAHDSKKIRCSDEKIFGEGHNCLDTQRNFFIAWNTIASDGRLVGTGAYVSKMKSSVHLGKKGVRAKMDKTKMWGVRRDKGFSGHIVNK